MKRIATISIVIALFLLPVFLVAQASKQTKSYRNEIGTDVISLINRIVYLNFSQEDYSYNPTYFINYKRLMKEFNFRAALGGYTHTTERPDKYLPDQVNTTSSMYINFRIGLEKNFELSKRWRFHYGIDNKHTIYNYHHDGNTSSGGWAVGSDVHDYTLALAPTLIIEFKVNQRLSFQTEANYAVYFSRYEYKPFATQIEENPSTALPSLSLESNTEFGTEFSVPRFLILAIRI